MQLFKKLNILEVFLDLQILLFDIFELFHVLVKYQIFGNVFMPWEQLLEANELCKFLSSRMKGFL